MSKKIVAHTIVGTVKQLKVFNPRFEASKNRTVRVYIPTDYDKKREKPYHVIYMFDGQNLFDAATSFIGREWQIDETIESLIKEGYPSAIVVGIDNSSKRSSEFTPAFGFQIDKPIDILDERKIRTLGESTIDFLVDSVMPFIESKYNVGKTKEYRSIGGSSLGGLMTTLGVYMHPELFTNAFAFSTAFQLYEIHYKDDRVYHHIIETLIDKDHLNQFTYMMTSGGRGFEKGFLAPSKRAYDDLISNGFDKSKVKLYINQKFAHNETQWAYFFKRAYKYAFRNERQKQL